MNLRITLLLIFTLILSAFTCWSRNINENNAEIPIEGNILHCFDWTIKDITEELPAIAEAGFVAVQLSPLQRNVASGWNWSDPYRPYDFKFSSSGFGTDSDLKELCSEASKYGISIIVDVVFNHVDNPGYRDSWWNLNNRLRSGTSNVNYSNRNSITHDRIGDYPDVNSENPEVIERAKSYIEELKSLGVKGIRFDAAKHIALPSEGCDFWKVVTSVPGLFYYGEILDSPGGSNATNLMKEYTSYMSVTDDSYSSNVRNASGVPTTTGNWSTRGIDASKLVYWGESHDTYANTPQYGGVTKNQSQGLIDKAYASVASRAEGTALYFSRPAAKDFGSIKVGQKGSMHFTSKEVAEINKFKKEMIGNAESYSYNSTASSTTRKDGGAVIVKKSGSGEVEVPNGEGYCPEGKYYDRISGNEFIVTKQTISGKVGKTGIAVIYGDFVPGDDFEFETEDPEQEEDKIYVYCTNPKNWNKVYIYLYVGSYNNGWPGAEMTKSGDLWVYEIPEEFKMNARVMFNDGGSNKYPGRVDSPSEDGYLLQGKSMISDGTGNDNWKEYTVDSGVENITEEDFDLNGAKWFTTQGTLVKNPSERGIYIVVSPSGKTKKIMIK